MHSGKWARVGVRSCSVIRLGFLWLTLGGAAMAQDRGAASLGAGMTGLADGNNTGEMGDNVAAVALTPHYDVTAGVGFGPEKLLLLRAYAMDSRTSVVTMGAGYYRSTDVTTLSGSELPGWKAPDDDLLNPAEHQGVNLSLAYPMLSRHLAIGVTGRYDWRDGERTGKESKFNFGITAAGRPLESLTLAMGLRNALLLEYPDVQRQMDASIRWDPGPFLGLEVDGAVPLEKDFDWTQARLGAGATIGLAEVVALRAGWSTQAGENDVTAGLGLMSEHAQLDYGIRFGLGDPLILWNSIDLKILF